MSEKVRQKIEEQLGAPLDKETWDLIEHACKLTGKTPAEVIDASIRALAEKYGVKV